MYDPADLDATWDERVYQLTEDLDVTAADAEAILLDTAGAAPTAQPRWAAHECHAQGHEPEDHADPTDVEPQPLCKLCGHSKAELWHIQPGETPRGRSIEHVYEPRPLCWVCGRDHTGGEW